MNLLIVANGNVRNPSWYKTIIEKTKVVIAADGGADNCIKLGISPDYIIGDLDSISEKAKKIFEKKSKIIFNPDQNKTDLQLAIGLANSLGPEKITVIGAIGERMDHTIANIMCLLESAAPIKMLDEFNDVYFVDRNIEMSGKPGDIVSVIAVSGVEGLTYGGLKWGLKNRNVPSGWIGVCNEMTGSRANISLSAGKLIVIKAREK